MAGSSRRARCPGVDCGFEDSERAVLRHIRGCQSYAAAYRADPDAVLDPVEAYRVAHPPAPSRASRPAPAERSKSEEPAVSPQPGTVGVEVWTWPESLAEQARW